MSAFDPIAAAYAGWSWLSAATDGMWRANVLLTELPGPEAPGMLSSVPCELFELLEGLAGAPRLESVWLIEMS